MILGIETSCDDTGLALFDPRSGIVKECLSSQISLHREHGGIVPGIAIREHLNTLPLLLKELGQDISELGVKTIAVTHGPGLAGCLAIGIACAKSLSFALDVPVVGINHLQAHAFSAFLPLFCGDRTLEKVKKHLPHLGLLVSGGNTILFSLDWENDFKFSVLAETQDDAAGEALDKGARLLGLDYPGGPEIERLAQNGDSRAFDFPMAFRSKKEQKFSFSGLKTSLRYFLDKRDEEEIRKELNDICASYQSAVVDILTLKAKQALAGRKFKSLGLSGGVSNNQRLRNSFEGLAERNGIPFLVPEKRHSGDNGTMVAYAAFLKTMSEECKTTPSSNRITLSSKQAETSPNKKATNFKLSPVPNLRID